MANKINKPIKIILHCSNTPDRGDRYGAKEIDEWHKENGWNDPATGIHCGYHYVIRRTGVVESFSTNDCVRPESSIGAHCRGHNTNSLGVCFMATYTITMMQMEAWFKLYRAIYSRHKIGIDNVLGHNELSRKECPGFTMHTFRLFTEREFKCQMDLS